MKLAITSVRSAGGSAKKTSTSRKSAMMPNIKAETPYTSENVADQYSEEWQRRCSFKNLRVVRIAHDSVKIHNKAGLLFLLFFIKITNSVRMMRLYIPIFTTHHILFMKTIKDSLKELVDFSTIEVKEGDTVLHITQLAGKGVLITVDNIDYFRNHLMMDSEMWENFLYRFTYDRVYRFMHVINKRWYGSMSMSA